MRRCKLLTAGDGVAITQYCMRCHLSVGLYTVTRRSVAPSTPTTDTAAMHDVPFSEALLAGLMYHELLFTSRLRTSSLWAYIARKPHACLTIFPSCGDPLSNHESAENFLVIGYLARKPYMRDAASARRRRVGVEWGAGIASPAD